MTLEKMQQILGNQIKSRSNHVDRLIKSGALEMAAHENAVREGLNWAYFVLTLEMEKEKENGKA